MASIRSSLPSRLRQLLSSEGAIGPSIKLDPEPPANIKEFVDKVIQCPLQDIAIPLSGFCWEYGKGNFLHWRLLFLHFDTYFKTYISCRNDLLLSDEVLGDVTPFPTEAVLQILRVMRIILENCHNKSSFSGIEHFKLLLASTIPEILIAALEVLSALVKITPSKLHASGKMVGCGSVNTCLLSLAQGWGSKEEGLGLYSCITLHERNQEDGLCLFPSEKNNQNNLQYKLGSSLYFELHSTSTIMDGSDGSISSGTSMIHLPDTQLRTEDELSLMKSCIQQYNVPPELRFPLLTRIRYARALHYSRLCRLYSKICLLAFVVLVQSSDSHDELVSFFANEPEYTNELIRIVRSEENISGIIRTAAMTALGAQLAAYSASHERARILSGSSISFAGGNRMILLNVLQRAILSLKTSADLSAFAFVEALLQFYLLHVVSSSSTGSVVRGSGMVPTFLPLLEDSDPTHLHLVCLAVKTLQKLMDYSNTAVTLFRDLGGVEHLVNRLQIEVHRVIESEGKDSSMVIGESSINGNDQFYAQKRLVRALLKALGSATYGAVNPGRTQNSYDVSLSPILAMIFSSKEKFGGEIYSSAVSLMSEMIHKDPTCFSVLFDLGLPSEFLSSVVAGILPSSKAITCIPNGLGAICLNSKGLESVRETSALRFLVDIFTDRKYVMAMNEGIVPLANAVEELLRHVSSLRSSGVDLIIEIINKTALLGETEFNAPLGKSDGNDAMDMDSAESADKENAGGCSQGAMPDLSSPVISDEQCMQLCIFHVMVLVHRTMENSETCRLFVEKSGIEALVKLLLRPSITQSSEGMSIALHSTMVFKCFTQHHSTPLARAICSSLRHHLEETLTRISAVSVSCLLDPRVGPDPTIFSSLSLVEFLLFLAASKDSRWVTSLLAEFGNGSKDVLEDIGQIHREALWQIALLEETKAEIKDESSVNHNASRHSDLSLNDSEDPRLNSVRQFLDPLLRRRTSGWSFESQFFDLINLYRDLTRSSSLHQRQIVDPSSDLQLEGNRETHQPGSSDLTESSTRRDESNQRSYRQSCCDMLRSLIIHITHLFQELGKAMVSPSRRRDDLLNVSPSSKSVASTFASIAMDHMNFAGQLNTSASEASVSSKSRYFGKVIEFIDEILLEKPDSCNPIILNCLYGRGVIQTVLTTFEATILLPFSISRTPASPMETDEGRQNEAEETDHLWIYGPSASYGKFMDHLVTSSFILSPFNKHLLAQPLVNSDVPFPRDAETFVKVLQSMVLKAVLPVWSHPRFPECSYEFITTVVNIFRHIFSGVEVKTVSSNVGRLAGPPPNESAISTIVEMGFSRSRAEEALRQVGSNSVELAMEWLFSHSEETQEDDELARALAMSLGNSGSDAKEDVTTKANQAIEEELVQLPPIDELLSTCRRLLQTKDTLAFPVRDLLVLVCSQNEGKERPRVISFIIEQLKLCGNISDSGNQKLLSSFFHVLALVLNEDVATRELASKSGFVKVASDLILCWSCSDDQESPQVPKWVTSAFIAIDRLAQVDTKLNADILEHLKKKDTGSQPPVVIDEDKLNTMQMPFGAPSKYLDLEEQKRLIEIACSCIRKQLPSETTHAVLQLCSTLTRTHAVAVTFLESDGLRLLLSLPASSLFVGFDNVAAAIIRHILEDSQTLQQAMESEIRHSFATAANRQSSGRLTPRNFLTSLISVVQRNPVTFMQAAKSVCQIEMVGERPYIVLTKDRDKDKSKEKEKEKDKAEEKEKQTSNDVKVSTGGTISAPLGSGHGKIPDANSKISKTHRKPPQSFVNVIDHLLDSIISFVPPPLEDESVVKVGSSSDMEVDASANKGKGKAVASPSDSSEVNNQESFVSMAKVVFILKLLTEILLMYASSVHILVRKDAEICSYRGIPQRGGVPYCTGGIFHQILYQFLPYSKSFRKEKKSEVDWHQKLASKAGQFLVASCVRSNEARKRIFTEISIVLNDFVKSVRGFRAPKPEIQALVDLLNDVLAARTPTGSYISAEASVTFIEAGLVQSLTRTLHVLDLDHTDSSKAVTGIVKVLESVTKEHIHAFESVNGKLERMLKPTDPSGPREGNTGRSQTVDATTNGNDNLLPSDQIDSFRTVQNYGGSEAVTEDMEHDQDIDGGFVAAEDDFMQENAQDTQNQENGLDSVGIRFEIGPATQGSLDEEEDEDGDADEMSGDEVDEDEDDEADDEHNDIDEDEAHHLPHTDTDQDDHDIDEDEFDEEVMEEDEDEEDDGDGVILQLGDGMNGVNVFDHIEVFGRDSISSEAFHVMPVEIFGSRRQGRTTSIYNLLGRNGDNTAPSQHPLLVEPSSCNSGPPRQSGNDRGTSNRNPEGSLSRLDSVFRSLRNGRQGHRLNLLANESQLSGGSNSSVIPQGLEDLLVSSLRRPSSEKPSDTSAAVESQIKNEITPSPQFTETQAENQSSAGDETSSRPPQSAETQYDQNDVLRDVEAVSQESGGSGATLGESLRSLDVEIGSADGHDDGGDTRMRRVNPLFGNSSSLSGRDASLHSVTEVTEDPIREADQSVPPEEEQHNHDAESIDPAFLDALPEELRAEVLSAQPSEAPQSQNPEPQNNGDIDPEFLAALPPDIREEVLAQQRAQRMHQSQELEGQPVEMDTVSIIATFPSELREEVLLTSSDAILANLTPALVAEANMLRERFARRYNQSLFGIYPRTRRGDSSRRGGDGLDRVGNALSRRSLGIKPVEAEGLPLVDTEGLRALIRLLRVVQPLYKNEYRLLLNLCAHAETRVDLLKILMDLLMWDVKRSPSRVNASEPPYRLYACQSHVMYSRPQCVDGVPPLVSRRALETLTYLARNHPLVAKLLLEFRLSQFSLKESSDSDGKRGKAVMVHDDSMLEKSECPEGQASVTLLLSLLNQSLYLRSIAHLEQLLSLLDVIIDNAVKKSNSSDDQVASASQQPNPQVSTSGSEMNIVSTSASGEGTSTTSGSFSDAERLESAQVILNNLPKPELQLLCSLLAREGLSDNAYTLAAEVLRKLVTIAPNHCHLFITELSGSVRKLTMSAAEELSVFGDMEKAVLSTATHGAQVLRVLQALSSLVFIILDKDKKHNILPEVDHSEAISLVWDINAALEPLWQELSSCISKIESYSDVVPDQSSSSVKPSNSMPPLPAGTQNILPYIESFFVTCEKLHPGQSGTAQDVGINTVSDVDEAAASVVQQKTSGPAIKVEEKHVAFVRFCDRHRKLLNAFVRQNPGLLEKSFALMLKVPRFIDFDNKRSHFRSKIKHQHDHHHSPLRISVRRAYILEDSYNQLRMRSAEDLKGRLTVHFQGEEGIDAGGLTREWYQLLSRVIFDKGALLFTTVGNESTFQPNPNSVYQTEHLSYFKFVGRVVGKALFDGQLLDVHFTRSFYKHILGVKVTYHDIEAIDPGYFKNLKWMLENDISDVLDLTFSIDADEEKLILYERAQVTDYELIPGGRNIKVTEENKHQYVDLVAEHRLTTAIRPQINAFLEGFNDLIHRDLISIFNDKELELLISGLPDIDLDDLRANTEYSGYSAASPIIQWFWDVVQEFSKEDKARLLQFVTGTSKVPLEGFGALQGISGSQKFQIHKAYGSADHLPSAHTCFNQLDLPEYPSKERLEERLLLAIHEGSEGFGFG
ncbi:E3 ubiquitin-protein ligase UPL2-like isoform X2 [Andrographis paniculata]|uniref:E3 ubiquitin-protein ligase UPL2-like isoform X2 n=1 Tax=Andrographis paniculata TaxID=175694 RepID=UPI0021E8EBD5|nr:E3 ubiquitin-protein ligase UPL2-like isoform X2 [Andrographis paniculata]